MYQNKMIEITKHLEETEREGVMKKIFNLLGDNLYVFLSSILIVTGCALNDGGHKILSVIPMAIGCLLIYWLAWYCRSLERLNNILKIDNDWLQKSIKEKNIY